MPLWQEMTVGKGGYPRAYVQPPASMPEMAVAQSDYASKCAAIQLRPGWRWPLRKWTVRQNIRLHRGA